MNTVMTLAALLEIMLAFTALAIKDADKKVSHDYPTGKEQLLRRERSSHTGLQVEHGSGSSMVQANVSKRASCTQGEEATVNGEEYKIMGANTNDCATNYAKIPSESECATAGNALGCVAMPSSQNGRSGTPGGCLRGAAGGTKWNPSFGSAAQWKRPICKKCTDSYSTSAVSTTGSLLTQACSGKQSKYYNVKGCTGRKPGNNGRQIDFLESGWRSLTVAQCACLCRDVCGCKYFALRNPSGSSECRLYTSVAYLTASEQCQNTWTGTNESESYVMSA